MLNLNFAVIGVSVVRSAAAPMLSFRLRIREGSGTPIHAMLLRAQIQIQPRRRKHATEEQTRLLEVFGTPDRWRETLRSLLWTQASVTTPAFEHDVEIEIPVACTYDMEVLAAKYLSALDSGEVPLVFLFSGTVFSKSENGFHVHQVPWDKEAQFRFPVSVWRELMDRYFPGACWVRLRRESMDALQRFKARNALMTWDDVVNALVNRVEEPVL